MANEFSQNANNNNNSTIVQININTGEFTQEMAELLKTLQINNNSSLQIQAQVSNSEKLNKLYEAVANIINNFDSLFYISKKNMLILKEYITKMEIFEEDFKNESLDGLIFYNNMFALLLRVDKNLFVTKYEKSPDYIRQENNNKYLYAVTLYEIDKKDEAYKIINQLLDVSDEETYFLQKCFFLFNDNRIKELKKILGIKKKNDKYGYYGVFELYIKYAKDKNINKLKKLNSKYKGKFLFHLYYAKLIYENDKSNRIDLRDNLKRACLALEDNDLLMYLELLNLSLYVNQGEYVISIIDNKKFSSNIINSRILNILVYKVDKSEHDIEKIKNILSKLKDCEYIDVNNAYAILSISMHKELEAIDYFNKSFVTKKDRYTAYNLLNLVLKNNDQRNFDKINDYIDVLDSSENASDHMLIASAYLVIGKSYNALENAYQGAVLSQNNYDYFMKFWVIHMQVGAEPSKEDSVIDDCVVKLKEGNNVIVIALDSQIIKYKKILSFQNVKYNRDKMFDINIKGKCIGDTVIYNGKNYKIEEIVNKYDYFIKSIFPLINNGKYFKAIKSEDPSDPLKEIKEFLIEDKKNNDNNFKMYDLETSERNGLPLSCFVNNEDRTYQNILMHLLYMSPNTKLYSGELNEVNLENKIAIDITSLVMLNQFDCLEKLLTYKDNVYITQSTINTISKTFNYYLNNKKERLSVFAGEDNQLYKQELTEKDNKKTLEFWRKIYEISQCFNIINHESSMNKRNLESCQIDTIDYSIKENCILISEDLLLKKLAYAMNNNKINSSNFISLIDKLCNSVDEYINIISSLSDGNYIYCISDLSFLKILLYSFKEEGVQEKVVNIITNVLSTNFLFNLYIEIIMRTLVSIYYYDVIDNIVFFIKVLDLIFEKCNKYNNTKCRVIIETMKSNLINEN